MGDFQRHVFESLHELTLRDAAGTLVARLTVTASVTRRESWAHLEAKDPRRAAERAGPHNRRILEERTGFTVTLQPYPNAPPAEQLTALVEQLRTNNGLQGAAGSLVAFDAPEFVTMLRARLAELGLNG